MTQNYKFSAGTGLVVSDTHSGVEATETVISLSLLEKIKEVMWEMVYEIEAEANERYKDESGEFFHPLYERRYERDVSTAKTARNILEFLK